MRRKYKGKPLYLPKPMETWPFAVFIGVEFFLYVWFLLSDGLGKTIFISADIVKYVSICLCAVMSVYLFCRWQANRYMLYAQLLILPADLILLFAPQFAVIGILLFILVQVCYLCRLKDTIEGFLRIKNLEVLFGGCFCLVYGFLLLFLYILRVPMDYITVTASIYIVLFFFGVVSAVYEAIRFQKRELFLMAVGLCLFFLCDLHVGIYYLFQDVSGAGWYFTKFAGIAMWLFYLPGQVLLVLGSFQEKSSWSKKRTYYWIKSE